VELPRAHWYRHAPFLPIPPRDYMQWRMFTAYGDEQASRLSTTS